MVCARGYPGVSGRLPAKSGHLSTTETMHTWVSTLAAESWAYNYELHIHVACTFTQEITVLVMVQSCGIKNGYWSYFYMCSWHSSLYSWSNPWCSVSTDYSLRTDWLVMINMSIPVKCTVNCTGTLFTKWSGCMCCLLTSLYQVAYHLLPACKVQYKLCKRYLALSQN